MKLQSASTMAISCVLVSATCIFCYAIFVETGTLINKISVGASINAVSSAYTAPTTSFAPAQVQPPPSASSESLDSPIVHIKRVKTDAGICKDWRPITKDMPMAMICTETCTDEMYDKVVSQRVDVCTRDDKGIIAICTDLAKIKIVARRARKPGEIYVAPYGDPCTLPTN